MQRLYYDVYLGGNPRDDRPYIPETVTLRAYPGALVEIAKTMHSPEARNDIVLFELLGTVFSILPIDNRLRAHTEFLTDNYPWIEFAAGPIKRSWCVTARRRLAERDFAEAHGPMFAVEAGWHLANAIPRSGGTHALSELTIHHPELDFQIDTGALVSAICAAI